MNLQFVFRLSSDFFPYKQEQHRLKQPFPSSLSLLSLAGSLSRFLVNNFCLFSEQFSLSRRC
eukprot:m.8788 g.8788  ORF g.8788 m.8788 type:complete len:62 (+) comp20850_c0_seq1:397-582(+)